MTFRANDTHAGMKRLLAQCQVVTVDFGAIPPEINSARIYSGPGSGPLIAAATAWDALAAELTAASAGYVSVISELASSQWLGPASMAMVAAVVPHQLWISATARNAELTGIQARAAAAAFETAHAMTVPPPVVAANRSLLQTLIATNFFGQNTPAIASTEFHYAEMWAQDAAAMYGYAASCASASMLTPFTAPPRTADSDGLGRQAAAVANAATTPVGGTASAISKLTPKLIDLAIAPSVATPFVAALVHQNLGLPQEYPDPGVGRAAEPGIHVRGPDLRHPGLRTERPAAHSVAGLGTRASSDRCRCRINGCQRAPCRLWPCPAKRG